ncbi:unnamed protein product [Ixodes pacificus]
MESSLRRLVFRLEGSLDMAYSCNGKSHPQDPGEKTRKEVIKHGARLEYLNQIIVCGAQACLLHT